MAMNLRAKNGVVISLPQKIQIKRQIYFQLGMFKPDRWNTNPQIVHSYLETTGQSHNCHLTKKKVKLGNVAFKAPSEQQQFINGALIVCK